MFSFSLIPSIVMTVYEILNAYMKTWAYLPYTQAALAILPLLEYFYIPLLLTILSILADYIF